MTTNDSNDPQNIGANAWTGNSVSAASKPKIELSSDMKPLSGKSVTSVPEEHRFDRVPPPAQNTKPEPKVPVGKYWENYKEMMERAGMADAPEAPSPDQNYNRPEPTPAEPVEAPPREPERSAFPTEEDAKRVFETVSKGASAAQLYDKTALALVVSGRAEFDIRPDGAIYEIVIKSKNDGQIIRPVGYAAKSVRPN